jgi:TonB family protein
MQREFALALAMFPLAALSAGQETAEPAPKPAVAQPANTPIHYGGPGVTAPVLLQDPAEVSSPRRCDELNGVVKLTAVIDANGIPRDVKSLQADDAVLGSFAVDLIQAERFKPGSYDGIPASVAIEFVLGLQTCVRRDKNAGDTQPTLTLKAHPVQSFALRAAPDSDAPSPPYPVGGEISAPVPTFNPGAHYSAYGRKKKIEGVCVINLIVDGNGVPQNVHVVKSLEPSLDQKAIEAVKTWQFKPAMKDGTTPVPVVITVEVDFELY